MSTSLAQKIYEAYPRHIGKAKALPAIEKVIEAIAMRGGWMTKEAASWLLYRVQRFADSPAGKLGTFTPHPTTWMNGGRYDDDDAEWQGTNGDSVIVREEEYEKKRTAEIDERARARREQNAKDKKNSMPGALTKLAAKVLKRKD